MYNCPCTSPSPRLARPCQQRVGSTYSHVTNRIQLAALASQDHICIPLLNTPIFGQCPKSIGLGFDTDESPRALVCCQQFDFESLILVKIDSGVVRDSNMTRSYKTTLRVSSRVIDHAGMIVICFGPLHHYARVQAQNQSRSRKAMTHSNRLNWRWCLKGLQQHSRLRKIENCATTKSDMLS